VQVDRAKVLSNTVKQKRKQKAGKWEVPLPKVRARPELSAAPLRARQSAARALPRRPQVRPVAEEEMFKVLHSGKRKKKQWKRMVTKVTFVGPSFTRKPPKYERFIRPMGARAALLPLRPGRRARWAGGADAAGRAAPAGA